ncbi:MAG: hypothetical protein MUE95_13425 [Cyclobacteriaceae bacterium]|jgi:hypothetical protein|nr:hypothetical protein [Cyclobacteriaceae bacterium]
MKKLVFLGILLMSAAIAHAYSSTIAIQTDKNSSMQVYVNGKLYNQQPGNFVRIKSNPGLFKLQVKVLNPFDKEWYMIRKDVRVEKGFEFYYKVEFVEGQRPELKAIRRYPVYTHYFLNPALYYKHPTS